MKIGSKILNFDTKLDQKSLFILWKIPFVITEGSLEQIRTRNWFHPLKPFSFRIVNTSLVSVWYRYCFSDDHLRFTCPADAFSFFKFLKNLKIWKFPGHSKKLIIKNLRNFPFGSTLERRFWIVSPFSFGWMSLWIPLELNFGSKVTTFSITTFTIFSKKSTFVYSNTYLNLLEEKKKQPDLISFLTSVRITVRTMISSRKVELI